MLLKILVDKWNWFEGLRFKGYTAANAIHLEVNLEDLIIF